jgi:SpoIID/LytB domain protein
MRRLLLLTALFVLLAPAASHAAIRIVVRGAGFGHGIGLSQYGAYGYAQHGATYRDILTHYYTGTRITPASTRLVRVLLQTGRRSVRIRGATKVADEGGGRALRPSATYVVRPAGAGVSVRSAGGKSVGRFAATVRVSGGRRPMRLLGGAINGVGSGLYRGSLQLLRGGGAVTVVNVVPLDSYVQGVVPGEMPSSWAPEALKAQAVAARSYALATIKPGASFDLYPDTRSQVYRGVTGEEPSTNAAVRSTAGEVVTYGGQVAMTYYFSTSGGETENIENSFAGSAPRPWLKGVNDPYDGISPRHRWRLTFTPRQLGSRLGAPGRFRKVLVIKRGVSPRIVRARVYGTRGTRLLSGAAIRSRLGLFDSWAFFTRVSTSQAATLRFAKWGTRVRRRELVGAFDPAPAGRRLRVERRRGRRWVRVATIRTSPHGRYRAQLRSPGAYRVRAGSAAGPAVRLR